MARKKIKCKVCEQNIRQKPGPGRPRTKHEKCKGKKKKTPRKKKKAVRTKKKKPKIRVKKKLKVKAKKKVKRTIIPGLTPVQRRYADEIARRARARMHAEDVEARKLKKYESAVMEKPKVKVATTAIELDPVYWEREVAMNVGSFYFDRVVETARGEESAIFDWVCNTYEKPCYCGTKGKILITTRTWVCDCGCGATAKKTSRNAYKSKMHLQRTEKLAEIHKQMFIDIGLVHYPL